jgi:general secretion pathway protein A
LSLTTEPRLDTPMYEDFYGFAQSPFTLTPDPRFLYLSATHDEAIRLLRQAIRRREGFIVLAGDIGTGKTTTCRAVIEQLDQTTFTSLILNPFVSVDELLREVLLDFGVVSREAVDSGRIARATRHELMSTLREFLLSLQPIGGVAVLVIDEAQHLAPEVLEQIRIISNIETNSAKLLQIVLVGQLDLLDLLAQNGMRQLDQRISLRAMLTPLTRIEMEAYISHRLGVAKGRSSVTFDAGALDDIHAYSNGVPRVINLLCDRALMLGAEAGSGTIGSDLVRNAARALALPVAHRTGINVPRWAMVATALLMVLGAASVAALYAVPAQTVVSAPAPQLPQSPAPARRADPIVVLHPPAVTPPLYPQALAPVRPTPSTAAAPTLPPDPLPPSPLPP